MRLASLGCSLVGLALLGGCGSDDSPTEAADTEASELGSGWVWSMSGISGGGFAQGIATDPFTAGAATLGGDSWGVYQTTSYGDDWRPSTRGNTGDNGDFFHAGIAYSRKYPGRVYALTGKYDAGELGGFAMITGDDWQLITRSAFGGEPTWDRSKHPRPTGNRVVVDYDSGSGIEYLYIAGGNGSGVKRSTDEGKTWTTIGLAGQNVLPTGMALSADKSTLFVGSHAGAYRIATVRGAATTTKLSAAPSVVEEMANIGGTIYAAAGTSGVFRVTNSGQTWTKLGGSFFPSTSSWAAIGGTGSTLYVGCANPDPGKSIGKSTDGGQTWKWVTSDPSKISLQVWGRPEAWWLAKAFPRIVLGAGGTHEASSIAVDAFDSDIVYVAGRSGVWKSEDGGTSWRPAVNHVGGTMHSHVKALAGGSAITDDTDWTAETTTDHFTTVTRSASGFSDSATLNLTKPGHTYKITSSIPRDFLLDGVSIADSYFRTACVRASDIDVSADGNYIYVAQFGGGVLVAHRTP